MHRIHDTSTFLFWEKGQLHANPGGCCTMSSIDHSAALLKIRRLSGRSLTFVRKPAEVFPGSYFYLGAVNVPAHKYILATGPSTERKLASNADFPRNVSLCRCSPSTSRARLIGPPMRYVNFSSSLVAPSHSCSPLANVWRKHYLRQFRWICTGVPFLLTKHVNLGYALVWFT